MALALLIQNNKWGWFVMTLSLLLHMKQRDKHMKKLIKYTEPDWHRNMWNQAHIVYKKKTLKAKLNNLFYFPEMSFCCIKTVMTSARPQYFFKQHVFLRNLFVGLYKICFLCLIHIYTYFLSLKIMFDE